LLDDKILFVMGGDVAVLPADIDGLRRLVLKQSKELSQLQEENHILVRKAEVLEDELRLLRHKIFGRRSERFSVEERQQSSLFDEAEVAIQENSQKLAEPTIEVSSHRRRTPGRKPLPADLPR
jgi:transposase